MLQSAVFVTDLQKQKVHVLYITSGNSQTPLQTSASAIFTSVSVISENVQPTTQSRFYHYSIWYGNCPSVVLLVDSDQVHSHIIEKTNHGVNDKIGNCLFVAYI